MEESALCTLICAAYNPLYSAAHAQSTGKVSDVSALCSAFSGMMPHARCASRKAPYRVDSFTDERQIGRFNTFLRCAGGPAVQQRPYELGAGAE